MHRRAFLTLAAAATLAGCDKPVEVTDPENTLVMDLASGEVWIALRTDLAPKHCARIKDLARLGFYDGLGFHRVIEGFVAQTGSPTPDGEGGSGIKLHAEFSDLPFDRGTVGMARGEAIHSADSQWFICFARQPSLDGKYTAFGQVIHGMERVDALKRGEGRSGKVENPDRIVALNVHADVYTRG